MKKTIAIGTVAIFLAACGDEVTEVNQINQIGMEVVKSAKDLPKCTDDNEGELAFVKGETAVRVCVDGEWEATSQSVKDTVYLGSDVSCKTEELKDKSGLKIVCNGDSIGVVLNGKDGEKGEDGEDGKDAVLPKDTMKNDSERVLDQFDSLVGYVQKFGPLLKGSAVHLYRISDEKSLKLTGENFTTYIADDYGRYKFDSRNQVSRYVAISVEGYSVNEVTGENLQNPVYLRAIVDLADRHSANVNLLTTLEYDRVYYLVTHENMTVAEAKKQALSEIMNEFYIDVSSYNILSEDLDVNGGRDADDALAAISILLQGCRTENELVSFLTEISNDMEKDGKWDGPNSDSIKTRIADWALVAEEGIGFLGCYPGLYSSEDPSSSYVFFRQNVERLGLRRGSVPYFEKYMRRFYSIETGLGICGSSENPVGTMKCRANQGNKPCIVYVCVDADSSKWQMAPEIVSDTLSWGHDFAEGSVRNGQLNTQKTYVYQDGNWRLGTELDSLLVAAGGTACLVEGDTSTVKYNNRYYVCTAQTSSEVVRKWVVAPDIYNDTYESRGECRVGGIYGDGSLLVGRVNQDKIYVCDNDDFRQVNPSEIKYDRVCVSYIEGRIIAYDRTRSLVCVEGEWLSVVEGYASTMHDDEGYEYNTILMGPHHLMTENLNYATDGSFCYNDDTTNCSATGRLYTWEDAMTACPVGWHLPTADEWNYFTAQTVMGRIISITDFGIGAVGYRDSDGNYSSEWGVGSFWSSTDSGDDANIMTCNIKGTCAVLTAEKNMAYSVRCFQDRL